MTVVLEPLPYPSHALEPFMSARTVDAHYRHHHAGYVNALNRQLERTPLDGCDLRRLIEATSEKPELRGIFRNAAQSWNHTFFWGSMRPSGGGHPAERCADLIANDFPTYEAFRADFVAAGIACFGSGWVWVTFDGMELKVRSTANERPVFLDGLIPLLACDVWEHAYYLDHQHRREKYLETFLDRLVDWDTAERRLASIGDFVVESRDVRRAARSDPGVVKGPRSRTQEDDRARARSKKASRSGIQ